MVPSDDEDDDVDDDNIINIINNNDNDGSGNEESGGRGVSSGPALQMGAITPFPDENGNNIIANEYGNGRDVGNSIDEIPIELLMKQQPEIANAATNNNNNDGDDDNDNDINDRNTVLSPSQMSSDVLNAHHMDNELLKPLWFARMIVKCPMILCTIIFVILVAITYVDSIFFEISEQTQRTFLVENNHYVEKYDTLTLATERATLESSQAAAVDMIPQTERIGRWIYFFMFELTSYKGDYDMINPSATDYWILTPENIKLIVHYENEIFDDQQWIDEFCYYDQRVSPTAFSCNGALLSLARIIYNTFDMDTVTVAEIKEFTLNKTRDAQFGPTYQSLFNPGVTTTEQTFIYRSFFFAGAPIATGKEIKNGTLTHSSIYATDNDRFDDQKAAYVEWADKIWTEITVKHNGEFTDGNLRITALCYIVYSTYFNVLLQQGMFFIIFAVGSVLVYMTFHLQSIFLASVALFEILMSFPLAYFMYRIVLQISHYDTLSSLIIFVLLGVGADDVFVFTDAGCKAGFLC
jgi:hypothetical protein